MNILGIGGLLGDAATAVLKDGRLEAAVEESKLQRRGKQGDLPDASIAACLAMAGIDSAAVDCVAVARPFPPGPEADLHLKLRSRFPNSRVIVLDHHTAHAASAFFPSPFEEASVLTLDRAGDFRSGSRWQARGSSLNLEEEIYAPDSLGELYGRVTELLGFRANADEHKVQWMSATGDDRFVGVFQEMIRNGSSIRIDRSFFDPERFTHGGFSSRFLERLGVNDEKQIPADLRPAIAAGIQRAVETAVTRMAGEGRNLCLAGGMGLNAILVAALERSGRFERVFVQPAAGNAGTSVGAALYAWHVIYRRTERTDMGNMCLGPSFTSEEIKQVLENCKLRFRYLLTTDELIETAVKQLAESRIIAWMHGRMEFGPRALGNRSLLASPLDPYSTENLNAFIKHREPFRKFAASVPAEHAGEYFQVGPNARFLATVGQVRPECRKLLESAILAEDLVRVHVVAREDNPLYWQLLHAAGKATGHPVLYNTSFNLFDEPLVCTPRDAVRSFYSSGIDAMFVGNFFLQK
jgi:carbamoyltransferase